jgi:hypothetical protein
VIPAVTCSKRRELVSLDLGGLDASQSAWRQLAAAAPRFAALEELRLTTWDVEEGRAIEGAEEVELLSGERFQLEQSDAGTALASAFPVRWLRTFTWDVLSGEEVPVEPGIFAGFWADHEVFYERRTT